MSWQQTFEFDRYGNRNFVEANTTFTGFDKLCESGSAVCEDLRKVLNPAVNQSDNRLSSSDGYVFDDSGNTTRDAQLRKFTYDAENKQVKVESVNSGGTVTGTIGEYVYDGDGKRIKKIVPSPVAPFDDEVTVFVYDAAGKLVAEYATEISQDPKVSYTTADHLGSPRILTDENGATISRRDFHPFGEEIITIDRHPDLGYAPDDVRQNFTSYERDRETHLDFAQARYHNFGLGRFSSPDVPLLDQLDIKPQSWNLYTYVLNNPLRFTDPSGKWHTDSDGNAVGDYDGECVEEMGACWDEDSRTWDFGGDKTPVEAYHSFSLIEDYSAFSLGRPNPKDADPINGNEPLSTNGIINRRTPQSSDPNCDKEAKRKGFIEQCIQERISSRVAQVSAARQLEIDTNMLWSMGITYGLGVPNSTISLDPSQWLPDSAVRNKNVAGTFAFLGIALPGKAGAGLLVQGATEATRGRMNYINALANARQITNDDQEICEYRAIKAGF